jgi:hypothetical protein
MGKLDKADRYSPSNNVTISTRFMYRKEAAESVVSDNKKIETVCGEKG